MRCAIPLLQPAGPCGPQATSFLCYAKQKAPTSPPSNYRVDCAGVWSPWGVCIGCGDNSKKQRKFIVTQQAQHDGAACSEQKNKVQSSTCTMLSWLCPTQTPSLSPTQSMEMQTVVNLRSKLHAKPVLNETVHPKGLKGRITTDIFPSLVHPDRKISSIRTHSEHWVSNADQDDDNDVPQTQAPTTSPTQIPTKKKPQIPTAAPTKHTLAPTSFPTPAWMHMTKAEILKDMHTPVGKVRIVQMPWVVGSQPTIPKNHFLFTNAPTTYPTSPTSNPTTTPSAAPSGPPTLVPTPAPTATPSAAPSSRPTTAPSMQPTANPSATPTVAPTWNPTTHGRLVQFLKLQKVQAQFRKQDEIKDRSIYQKTLRRYGSCAWRLNNQRCVGVYKKSEAECMDCIQGFLAPAGNCFLKRTKYWCSYY